MTINGQVVCASPTNLPDYCTPNPCKNGAVCSNMADGPLCTCTVDFCGDCCARPADVDQCPGGGDQQCPVVRLFKQGPLAGASSASHSSASAATTGAVVGAVVGGALVVAVAVVVVWRRKSRAHSRTHAIRDPIVFTNPLFNFGSSSMDAPSTSSEGWLSNMFSRSRQSEQTAGSRGGYQTF